MTPPTQVQVLGSIPAGTERNLDLILWGRQPDSSLVKGYDGAQLICTYLQFFELDCEFKQQSVSMAVSDTLSEGLLTETLELHRGL